MSEQSTEVKGFKNTVLGKVLFKIASIAGLQDALDGKAAASHTHSSSESWLSTLLAGKAAASHTHSYISSTTGAGVYAIDSDGEGSVRIFVDDSEGQYDVTISGSNIDNLVNALRGAASHMTANDDRFASVGAVKEGLAGKMDNKTIDTTPSTYDNHLISSRAVHNGLLQKQDKLPVLTSMPTASSFYAGDEVLYLGASGTYEFGQSYECTPIGGGQTMYALNVGIPIPLNDKTEQITLTAEQYTTLKGYLASNWNVDTSLLPTYENLGTAIVADFFTNDSTKTTQGFIQEIQAFFNTGNGAALGIEYDQIHAYQQAEIRTIEYSASGYEWTPKFALKSELPSQS